MQNRNKIRMVYLDMGRVLTRSPGTEDWQALIREAGIPEDMFVDRYCGNRYEYDKGTLRTESFWNYVVNGNGDSEISESRLGRLIDADTKCWADYDERMIVWSDKLRDAGYLTGILSNMPLPYARYARTEVPWFHNFHFYVLSAEIKQMKPKSEIYKTALSVCGIEPNEVLFIDDMPENIDGAKRAGMNGIVFTCVEDLNKVVTNTFGLPPII